MNITDLVTLNDNNTPVTTSLKIAEKFTKAHCHIMRAIKNLDCSEEFARSNFGSCSRIKNGRDFPYYEMTRDGFVFLVMGFTGKKAAGFKEDYIKAFNAMEQKLMERSDPSKMTRLEILKLALESEEQRQVAIEERDEAIRTKAWISDKKTASAMGTASAYKKKYLKLKAKTAEPTYFQARAIPNLTDRFNIRMGGFWVRLGHALRRISDEMALPPKKVADASYGKVNMYHKDVVEEFIYQLDCGYPPKNLKGCLKRSK